MISADALLDALAAWKSRYGPPEDGELPRLLAAAAAARFSDPAELIRLHETLLFLRAWPRTPHVARLADAILFSMARRVAELKSAGADLSPFEAPEVSGVAGTSFTAVFSYEVARRLAARYPGVAIDWEAYDEPDRLGPVARRFVPLLEEEWPVEAHVPFREWMGAGRPRGRSELRTLLDCIGRLRLTDRDRADLYESLQLPLQWKLGDVACNRSRLRLKARRLFCHTGPLLRRRDVSLPAALEEPPLPVARVPAREVHRLLDIILDTSAMRYRELYGFTHPDAARVFRADAGRGVEICFFGVPPAWRLPLRAYHAGMFFKNGVPAGYVEVLSLFERAEVGFNLYYTFREGESAWLYARLLRLFRQTLGVNTFSVDPYQIGHENEEAIDSGAFWFYRKLGFRPVRPEVLRLAEREERRLERSPGLRSSRRTLEKLADGYILFEGPGATPGAWDRFHIRNLGLAVEREMARRHGGNPERMARWAAARTSRALGIAVPSPLACVLSLIPDLPRWSPAERAALAAIVKAKQGPDEERYLRLMQRHTRLRAAFLK